MVGWWVRYEVVKRWGIGVLAWLPRFRDLARWVSMKVRCWPPSLAKGLRALQTPAPEVQREAAPAARVMTPTSPLARAFWPRDRWVVLWSVRSVTSSGLTSVMVVEAGSRF